MTREKYFDYEEDFHSKSDRKASRKERKIITDKDRSKYKKTDTDQKKKTTPLDTPMSDDSKKGQVLSISPEGILVMNDGKQWICQLKGALKQEKNKTKNLVAVGDFVAFIPKDEQSGTIHFILPRKSILSRADNLSRRKEQLIAVNIDQVFISCSVVNPSLKPYLVDRYIIAAQKGNMEPIIVINKTDLLSCEDIDPITLEVEKEIYAAFIKSYTSIGIKVISVSTMTGEGIDKLKECMRNRTSVFSGQSGVGKSSLINATTGSSLRTGEIVSKTNKGSHTTTSTHLVPLEDGGFCVDTPGIKSFGIWDLQKEELTAYYPEFAPYSSSCKFPNCSHMNEPECAVINAVENGEISELRFGSYCALMTSLSEEHRHR